MGYPSWKKYRKYDGRSDTWHDPFATDGISVEKIYPNKVLLRENRG